MNEQYRSITKEELESAELPLEMWCRGEKRVVIAIQCGFCAIEQYSHLCFDCYNCYGTRFVCENYKIKLPPAKVVTLYECMTNEGSVDFLTDDGFFPSFSDNSLEEDSKDNLKRKTGRICDLNLDTWELSNWRQE